jgi:hypothetical protein
MTKFKSSSILKILINAFSGDVPRVSNVNRKKKILLRIAKGMKRQKKPKKVMIGNRTVFTILAPFSY